MNDKHDFSDKFLMTLVKDVVESVSRAEANEDPSACREAMRTIFSAIEGIAWRYKDNIGEIAESLDIMDDLTRLAFAGVSYTVSDNGKLTKQQRFIPLTSMIRFTTNIASQISTAWSPDFTQVGWSHLKQAIIVRNRVTHPKSMQDMIVSIKEIQTAQNGLIWLLKLVADAMEAANSAFGFNVDATREFLEKLKADDPDAHAIYKAVLLKT